MADKLGGLPLVLVVLALITVFVLGGVRIGRVSFLGELRQSGITIGYIRPAQGEPYWQIVEAP